MIKINRHSCDDFLFVFNFKKNLLLNGKIKTVKILEIVSEM